mmetsp:Transcript_13341/g.48567  ORF Transcript_13341/g.48567 Transcript_13341/m.48567 type:complete len:97 (+) Transcript_13341:247-537(+)
MPAKTSSAIVRPQALRFLRGSKPCNPNAFTRILGAGLCAFALLSFAVFVYCLGRPAQETNWAREDLYYTLVVPSTLPVTIFFVYLNWLGLQLFLHN